MTPVLAAQVQVCPPAMPDPYNDEVGCQQARSHWKCMVDPRGRDLEAFGLLGTRPIMQDESGSV
jgi:hypothetical protein